MVAPIRRQATQCSIQNRRTAGSGLLRVNPLSAIGWEKQVGLKSRPKLFPFAQSIQGRK